VTSIDVPVALPTLGAHVNAQRDLNLSQRIDAAGRVCGFGGRPRPASTFSQVINAGLNIAALVGRK